MKVYIKSVRSKQPNCLASAIFTEDHKELFRVNFWDNDTAANHADKTIADWLKANKQYTLDDNLSFKYS